MLEYKRIGDRGQVTHTVNGARPVRDVLPKTLVVVHIEGSTSEWEVDPQLPETEYNHLVGQIVAFESESGTVSQVRMYRAR